MRTLVLGVSALIMAGLMLSEARAQDRSPSGIKFVEAIQKGMEEVPQGQLILARPEFKKKPLIGIYFWVEGTLIELEMGPQLEIEKREQMSDESLDKNLIGALKNRKGAKIPLARYLEIAKEKGKGEPSRIEVKVGQSGKLFMVIDVGSGTGGSQVTIDMTDGKVVSK